MCKCLAITVLVDIIVSFVTLYLFLKPLNILSLFIQDTERTSGSISPSGSLPTLANVPSKSNSKIDKFKNGNNSINKEFYSLIIKMCTLTVVMVLTTIISLVMIGLFEIQSIATVDVLINCVSIALFNQIHAKYFKGLCCDDIIFVKLFARYCSCCGYKMNQKQNEDVHKLDVEVTENEKQASIV